ncbi:MAG: SemiSWEET family transporter [Ferruginibacter sp.]
MANLINLSTLSTFQPFTMDWTELTGLIASALSSITFMPQVYKAWKTKSVADLSFAMLFIVFFSTVIWLIYGFGRGLLPVIICNSIICFLSIILIYFKFTFPR